MNTQVMAKAICRLGAASPGGLALPLATPTPSQMYAPRGVFFDGDWLVVADSGNHRLLLWHGLPAYDGQPADVVLGQPDFYSEGPRKDGLHLPTGVAIHGGRLLVADSWHHRILVWDRVPTVNNAQPDHAIGQPDVLAIEPNQDGDARGETLYWPYSLGSVEIGFISPTLETVACWDGVDCPCTVRKRN